MKTINIFLASSEELDYDRLVIGNLVRRLDVLYEKRGIRIRLFEWEDYDAAYNDRRKQDEYNELARKSDMFLSLFHRKVGEFTVEEFENAADEFKMKGSPKVYIFMKALEEGEKASAELSAFKKRIRETMGYYWCMYDSKESLQFQIVMQLSQIEGTISEELKVEEGEITLQGIKVASFDHLSFASGNEEYAKLCSEFSSLPEKIEKARIRCGKYPDDDDLQQDLQQKLDRYNFLQEQIGKARKVLFDTAKRIAKLQGENVTERMRRAMDAFMNGNVSEANIILNEAEKDAETALEEYRQSKDIVEQRRQNVINSIGELRLKASTLSSDFSIPAEERIHRIEDLYRKSEAMAEEIDLDKSTFVEILSEHSKFSCEYCSDLDEALQVARLLVKTSEKHFGKSNLKTADAYNNLGIAYGIKGQNVKELSYYRKALKIRKAILGEDNHATAISYHNIGLSLMYLARYDKALFNMKKALAVFESEEDNADLATCCDGIGNVLRLAGKKEDAMKYLQRALEIRRKVKGEMHQDTAYSYNNIGILLQDSGRFDEAYDFHKRALDIECQIYGEYNPNTAISYSNIAALLWEKMDNYEDALKFSLKALDITLKAYGLFNPETADAFNNAAAIYNDMENYEKAEEFYMKALSIRLRTLAENHPDIALSYNNLGSLYDNMGDYSKALDYSQKALEINENSLGKGHPDTIVNLENIASIHQHMAEFGNALEYFEKVLSLKTSSFGMDSYDIAFTYYCIGSVYREMDLPEKALEYYFKALPIYERELGTEDEETLLCYYIIAEAYEDMEEFEKAKEYYKKAGIDDYS